MYYCNVNGFQTKKESIRKIVDKLKPKIFVLCETKLSSGNAIKTLLPEYSVRPKPTKTGKSGLAICTKLQTFKSVLEVTTSSHNDIHAVRICMAEKSVRLILGYAPQETEKVDEREAFYSEFDVEVTNCFMADELPIVIGDLNAKLQKRDEQIEAVSPNGNLLLEVIEKHDLSVLNYDSKCNGKWTHVTRTTGAASVLDYVITCQEIARTVSEIVIDEECLFCPFRIQTIKGNPTPKFSDHNAIITKFHIEHQKKKSAPVKKWKITNEGMEDFHQLTTNGFDTRLPQGNAQEKYDEVEKRINTVMGKCFRKVKGRKPNQLSGEYMTKYKEIMAFAKKGRIQRKVARMYVQEIIKLNTN